MFGLGIWELLIVLAIIVVLFGAKRLPLIGEGLGGMITNFKSATKKNKDDLAKIDENTTVIKEDSTVVKEEKS
ncbi:MAG: twin-arginine translocase TatA/TatE family subunit [SAR324 cluster bacterium]|nr:twin-arginine translocase TatA/TatE family subunit [SAR324 cluster bacterium]MEC9460765.1 twin-arginine translocase TatA/TatE family subunit [SAR324 cluster bacterium]MED5436109.1 twin-arginine translocase TatA/TatE family subunit [SAR324 cluster bacterium]